MGITPTSDYERQIKSQGGIIQNYGGMNTPDVMNKSAPLTAGTTSTTPPTGPLFGSEFLQGLSDYLGGGGAQGLAGLGLLMNAYGRLGDVGQRGLTLGQDLAETQMGQAAFRPYTLTTSTGGQFGATIDPTTGQLSTTMSVSPEEQAFRNQLFGGAGSFYEQAAQPTGEREAAIYERMRSAMSPEEERQRLALEERLASQGRLGVRTAQFGGAPEQFALAQAQEEARNRAMLGAMGQAQREQAQQAALGQQYLMGSYMPQQQMLAALSPGQTAAAAQQQAQLYGTRLFGEATASGIDSLLASGLGQANLIGQAGTGLLSGLFASPSSSEGGGFLDIIRGLGEDLGIGG
jgi:hypothetical protein